MAKLKQGIFAPISGKIGAVVGGMIKNLRSSAKVMSQQQAKSILRKND